MATKSSIRQEIAKLFVPKTEITAEKVKDILTKMLDFSPEPFHFWTDQPVKFNENELYYSFKGFEQQTVNLTFNLLINKPIEGSRFKFKFDDKHGALIPILKGILQANNLCFVLPVKQFQKGAGSATNSNKLLIGTIPWSARIFLEDNILVIDFERRNKNDEEILNNAVVSTSITFHSPDFKN